MIAGGLCQLRHDGEGPMTERFKLIVGAILNALAVATVILAWDGPLGLVVAGSVGVVGCMFWLALAPAKD